MIVARCPEKKLKLSLVNLNLFLFFIAKPFKEELLLPLRSSRMLMEQDEPTDIQLDTTETIHDIVVKVCILRKCISFE